MGRHAMTEIVNHSRSTALKRYVICIFFTLTLSSAVVYTRHLFSPHEGFLTDQCNISENIEIKRTQWWNNDEDFTARSKMLKQK